MQLIMIYDAISRLRQTSTYMPQAASRISCFLPLYICGNTYFFLWARSRVVTFNLCVRASQFFAQEFLFPIASPFLCRFVARQLKTWNVFETIESPPWQQTTHYPVPRFWEKGNLGGGFFWGKQVSIGGCKSIECPAFRMQSQKLSKLPKANMPDDQRPTHQPINPPESPLETPWHTDL